MLVDSTVVAADLHYIGSRGAVRGCWAFAHTPDAPRGVQGMEEERDTANDMLTTADEAARQNAGQALELVKELTSHKR